MKIGCKLNRLNNIFNERMACTVSPNRHILLFRNYFIAFIHLIFFEIVLFVGLDHRYRAIHGQLHYYIIEIHLNHCFFNRSKPVQLLSVCLRPRNWKRFNKWKKNNAITLRRLYLWVARFARELAAFNISTFKYSWQIHTAARRHIYTNYGAVHAVKRNYSIFTI